MNSKSVLSPFVVTVVLCLAACKQSEQVKPTSLAATSSPSAEATTAAPAASQTPGLSASPRPASATVVAQIGTPGLITISASGATPTTIAIQAGRMVTWRNDDAMTHHIVSDEAGLFDTGDIPPGGSASITLTAPGIHDWHDVRAPSPRGTVRVQP